MPPIRVDQAVDAHITQGRSGDSGLSYHKRVTACSKDDDRAELGMRLRETVSTTVSPPRR